MIVLDWIAAFKLNDFKMEHMEKLLISCLVNNVDVSKHLMNDSASKNRTLELLDSLVGRNREATNLLEKKLFEKFSKNNLSTMAYKHARPNNFDKIPNTMKQRTLQNYMHNNYQLSGNDRRILALVCLSQRLRPSEVTYMLFSKLLKHPRLHLNKSKKFLNLLENPTKSLPWLLDVLSN